MKKLILSSIVLLILVNVVKSQSCLTFGYTITSQEQIDNFQTLFPDCTIIEGSLTIGGNEITDLSGLNTIEEIEGYLYINYNNILENLDGLENLNHVGGHLFIEGNPSLTSLTGLENLNYIEGIVQISGNELLSNLEGLDNLNVVGGYFYIQYSDTLTTLDGLENLDSIKAGLYIRYNKLLSDITGLENLNYVGGPLSFLANDTLTNMDGLENLNFINGDLGINYNKELSSLNGLESLSSINGKLTIGHNDVLTNLTGLDNIDHESISELYIDHNPSLSICEVQSICEYLENSGTAGIANNSAGCYNENEITNACVVAIDFNSCCKNNEIILYPNPTDGNFSISIESKNSISFEMRILDLIGNIILSDNAQHSKTYFRTLDFNTLPNGLYLLFVYFEDGSVKTERLVLSN